MHNGTLKCLRTKNGHALWANMDARSPSHISRSQTRIRLRSPVSGPLSPRNSLCRARDYAGSAHGKPLCFESLCFESV